jgi:hypothetical protein
MPDSWLHIYAIPLFFAIHIISLPCHTATFSAAAPAIATKDTGFRLLRFQADVVRYFRHMPAAAFDTAPLPLSPLLFAFARGYSG